MECGTVLVSWAVIFSDRPGIIHVFFCLFFLPPFLFLFHSVAHSFFSSHSRRPAVFQITRPHLDGIRKENKPAIVHWNATSTDHYGTASSRLIDPHNGANQCSSFVHSPRRSRQVRIPFKYLSPVHFHPKHQWCNLFVALPPPPTSAESGWIAWCTLCVAVSGRRKTRQPTAAHRIAERSDWHRFPTRRLSIAALNRGVSQSHFLFLTNRPMSSISFISRPSDVSRTPSAPPTDRLDQANSQFCVVEKSGSVATTTSTATIDGYLSLSGIPLYYINEAEELYLPGAHLHHQTDCHSFLSRSMVISVPDSLLCYADCFLGRQPD